MPLDAFHPAVAAWFARAFPAPTAAQVRAWPAIRSGRNTLVAAPTGSGKTLTAFMTAIDGLVRQGLDNVERHGLFAQSALPDETFVVYVSPLKALSNDIRINLEAPLAGIREELATMGLADVEIRTAVRTGDTPQAERALTRRKPPHILVTTPESLYVLLGSDSGRAMLSTVRTVIVDEIHAVAASKRGSHLALSLERLEALCGHRLTRIGLSATQKPIEEVARYLVGSAAIAADGTPDCEIVDIGYTRQRDLALELPPTPLSAVMSNDQWDQVYARLTELVEQHRTTLVFVNTRRMAERAAHNLAQKLGKEVVAAHHGSLSKELRLDAEQRLKRGELRVLVATASLELGIDIGDVDLVCQLGSPRSIAAFLQRVGRSGHAVGGTPKGRLFPQTRDELVECAALLDSVRRGELDALMLPDAPLDVLSQQIVAEASCREWEEDALYDWVRRAWPYAKLKRKDFDAIVRMLADGFTTRRGIRAGYLHRDAVNRVVRGRKGGRTTALMSGGTIPDTADYSVVVEPESVFIGTVNEDFAIESMAGDIFQLGNASYRILRVEPGKVRVEDAQGAPPSIPFWLGEAPGRTDELSHAVSRLREAVTARLTPLPQTGIDPSVDSREGDDNGLLAHIENSDAFGWLTGELQLTAEAARQVVDYLASTAAALGAMPTQTTLVLERFFDESGGTQLVIHTPYGSRINRAWGLALRKRFCRKFNFELQAAATEDAIILSLSTAHSFPLDEVARYLHSASAQDVLVQALLDAPLFGVRWRWAATTALALPRFVGGKKVPPQLQRMKSEDLLATVFPDQVACAENLVGEREVPDHPLVAQTLHDCLHEAMDVDGWLDLLRAMESGEVQVVARDLSAPSPFAAEVLNARPYAFLDDAPLEERRTQAVQSRRYSDARSADDLGRLDADAIDAVREECWPQVRNADEMHEALMGLGAVTSREVRENGWADWLQRLIKAHRATKLEPPALDRPVGLRSPDGHGLWIAAERLPQIQAIFAGAPLHPPIEAPAEYAAQPWEREDALVELLRSRLTGLGPTPAQVIADDLSLPRGDVDLALLRLQTEGYVMQGRFTPRVAVDEWCERHLLARIHRYTLKRLRREIEPVAPRDFMRFLFDWQRVAPSARVNGPEALAGVLAQLEGFEAPAAAWESELLPARVNDYSISWLDDLCTAGRTLWTRLRAGSGEGANTRGSTPVRATPVVLLPRRDAAVWTRLAPPPASDDALSSRAQKVVDHLAEHGASFFDELVGGAHLLRTELEDALAELVARGRVHCDSYAGLRALLVPASKRPSAHNGRRRRAALFGIEDAGRWALIRRPTTEAARSPEDVEHVARTLLRRYGVVCWRLLEREAQWLPPWRELVRVYHRLEARGEIRGGRFISGLSGEQFALPEAIGLLRQVRQRPHDGAMVTVSAVDPLNLVGTIVSGEKVARIAGSRILFRDGVPLATLVSGEVAILDELPHGEEAAVRRTLLREPERSIAGFIVPVAT
ncbi:DEAD/DEAH box helicase [Lysobacter panacisoli]|uniref:DEAD/DEAH box helicase n=1 Tax=Lysobacter panacisoli TaxID=1255263 RepID=A0ABP9L873_9GAMM|nr:DEAD/DEAH box helicase [Lysobacter panacisoli]